MFVFTLILSLLPSLAFSHESQAVSGISSVSSSDGKPWFTLQKTETKNSDGLVYNLRYVSAENSELCREEVRLTPNYKFIEYHSLSSQENVAAAVKLRNGTLIFEYVKNGKKESREVLLSEAEASVLALPPTVASLLIWKNSELKEKGEYEFLLAVPDRLDTYRFRFSKATSNPLTWVLKPVSFFVRAFVSPVYFIPSTEVSLKLIKNVNPPIKFKNAAGELVDRITDIIYEP